MIKLAVVLPAAGTGSRMRMETPKPFLRLKGATILEHTIRNFLRVDSLVQIVIATSNSWMSQANSIASSFKSDSLSVEVVEGGSERQFSIHHALQSLDDHVNLVAVHDAVRPFFSDQLIKSILNFRMNNFFYRILFGYKTAKYLKGEKFKMIISRSLMSSIFLILFKIQHILEIHTELKGLTKFLMINCDFINSKYIKKIILISKSLNNEFSSINKEKVLILHDGVDIKNFKKKKNQ